MNIELGCLEKTFVLKLSCHMKEQKWHHHFLYGLVWNFNTYLKRRHEANLALTFLLENTKMKRAKLSLRNWCIFILKLVFFILTRWFLNFAEKNLCKFILKRFIFFGTFDFYSCFFGLGGFTFTEVFVWKSNIWEEKCCFNIYSVSSGWVRCDDILMCILLSQ